MILKPIDPRVLADTLQDQAFMTSLTEHTGETRQRVCELLWFFQAQSLKSDGLVALTAVVVESLKKEYDELGRQEGYRNLDNPEYIPWALRLLCIPERRKNYGEHGAVCNLFSVQWPSLFDSLFKLMDQHAANTLKTIAETTVSKTIFRELEFSLKKNVPVPIIGESRIGKTKPASVWCAARPGRARLVDVPESNRDRDFVTAHADAFGIEYNNRTSTQSLRSDVQYVNHFSGLFLVYDESQFLVPINYSKSTAPHRLNWVRRQVVDRDRGCGLIATPQSYRQTLDQYVKTTGYRIEQWLGRLAPAVVLPADLGREDLMAVAKIHFPEMALPFLKLIAARAMRSEGYLKNLEITAKRAAFLSEEAGRSQVNEADVRQAIADMMPETVAESPALIEQQAAAASPRRLRGPSASRARTRCGGEFSDRSLTDKLPLKGGIETHLTTA